MTQNEQKAHEFCLNEISKLKLKMSLISTEYVSSERKILFKFDSPQRVDFRELVKSLKNKFKIAIEMRQMGPRDRAKEMGGLGFCGRGELCCKREKVFPKVTIDMVKAQGIHITPKIFGYCGKLKCSLAYEVFENGDTTETLSKSCESCSIRSVIAAQMAGEQTVFDNKPLSSEENLEDIKE